MLVLKGQAPNPDLGAFLGLPGRLEAYGKGFPHWALLFRKNKWWEARSSSINNKVYGTAEKGARSKRRKLQHQGLKEGVYITQWIGYLGRVGCKHVAIYATRL